MTPLLTVDNLRTYFHTREGLVRAVDGVSFHVDRGETLGIVGESGSGKSVTAYSLLGLLPTPPGRIEGGSATFDNVDLLRASESQLRAIRGKRISMVFQDPMSALNPYMTIGNQMTEPLAIHDGVSGGEARERAVEALQSVGIQDAAKRLASYPHEFSGGMRQRVMIAMALITRPQLLIADEPTTALDVTVQAQILELIVKLQDDLGMAVILITHDLGVIANTADRVLVMYAGRMAEAAPAHELFDRPRHPYTKALMDSLPSVHGKGETLYTIPGLPPDLSDRPPGCPFAPRCEHAVESCSAEVPDLEAIGDNHASACLRVQRGEL